MVIVMGLCVYVSAAAVS